MRIRLRTLLIVLAVGPLLVAVAYTPIEERVAYWVETGTTSRPFGFQSWRSWRKAAREWREGRFK
jgi:hypothetical protein